MSNFGDPVNLILAACAVIFATGYAAEQCIRAWRGKR